MRSRLRATAGSLRRSPARSHRSPAAPFPAPVLSARPTRGRRAGGRGEHGEDRRSDGGRHGGARFGRGRGLGDAVRNRLSPRLPELDACEERGRQRHAPHRRVQRHSQYLRQSGGHDRLSKRRLSRRIGDRVRQFRDRSAGRCAPAGPAAIDRRHGPRPGGSERLALRELRRGRFGAAGERRNPGPVPGLPLARERRRRRVQRVSGRRPAFRHGRSRHYRSPAVPSPRRSRASTRSIARREMVWARSLSSTNARNSPAPNCRTAWRTAGA